MSWTWVVCCWLPGICGGIAVQKITIRRGRERGVQANRVELRRHMALLGLYFTQYLKVRISHRGDFLIGLATSMAATIFQLGFMLVLFRNVPPGGLALR